MKRMTIFCSSFPYKVFGECFCRQQQQQDDDILINLAVFAALIRNRRSSHLGIPNSWQWVNNVLPKFDGGRMRSFLILNQAGSCFPKQKFCSTITNLSSTKYNIFSAGSKWRQPLYYEDCNIVRYWR